MDPAIVDLEYEVKDYEKKMEEIERQKRDYDDREFRL